MNRKDLKMRILLTAEEKKIRHNLANQIYRRSEKGKAVSKKHQQKQKESGWLKKFRSSKYQRERMHKYHLLYKTTEHGRSVIRRNKKIQAKKNIVEDLARAAVRYAIKIGKIPHIKTMQCISCQDKAVHYHHFKGYSREHRLSVIPLCMPCHKNVHRQ